MFLGRGLHPSSAQLHRLPEPHAAKDVRKTPSLKLRFQCVRRAEGKMIMSPGRIAKIRPSSSKTSWPEPSGSEFSTGITAHGSCGLLE